MLCFTHRERLVRAPLIALLLVLPFCQTILSWTNAAHHLYHTTVGLDQTEMFVLLQAENGPGYALVVFSAYLPVLIGVGLLAQAAIQWSAPFRGQALVLIAAALVPLLAHVVSSLELGFLPPIDYTPFAFAIAGAIMAWGLFRYKMLRLVPVARDSVFEHLRDSVIVLDDDRQVVDANAAAIRLLGGDRDHVIGRPLAVVAAHWPELLPRTTTAEALDASVTREVAGTLRHYDLRLSPLHSGGDRPSGQLLVLRDTTERVQADAALREAEARSRAIVEATPIPIVIQRVPDGLVLYANRHAAELLGEERDSLVGRQTIAPYFNPDERARLRAEVEQAGMLHNRELRLTRPTSRSSGSRCPCSR